jgi:hypothetical protein
VVGQVGDTHEVVIVGMLVVVAPLLEGQPRHGFSHAHLTRVALLLGAIVFGVGVLICFVLLCREGVLVKGVGSSGAVGGGVCLGGEVLTGALRLAAEEVLEVPVDFVGRSLLEELTDFGQGLVEARRDELFDELEVEFVERLNGESHDATRGHLFELFYI